MSLDSLFSTENMIVAAASMVAVLLAVFVHYEVLSRLYHWLPRLGNRPRPRMLLLVLVIFITHNVEIWLFTVIYWLVLVQGGIGGISSDAGMPELFDLVYFSAVTYTTVGYGDLAVTGPARILAGTEGLLGLILITWSASFTFFEWRRNFSD